MEYGYRLSGHWRNMEAPDSLDQVRNYGRLNNSGEPYVLVIGFHNVSHSRVNITSHAWRESHRTAGIAPATDDDYCKSYQE